jgi:hypothetical protein
MTQGLGYPGALRLFRLLSLCQACLYFSVRFTPYGSGPSPHSVTGFESAHGSERRSLGKE